MANYILFDSLHNHSFLIIEEREYVCFREKCLTTVTTIVLEVFDEYGRRRLEIITQFSMALLLLGDSLEQT